MSQPDAALFERLHGALASTWRLKARPKQLPPEGEWSTWVLRAGRGFGKTRTGAGWIDERAYDHPGRWIALIGSNPADIRDYMIEGPGGILRNTIESRRPLFEPSKRRLTWPNGSWATLYSDEEPDQLRGYSGDTAWVDEFAKFKNAKATWENLQFGMREKSTDQPRVLITTTPRPLKILREIEAMSSTRVVMGRSDENRENLDPRWFDQTLAPYRETRLGRQEIEGQILEDTPGALWTGDVIEKARIVPAACPEMQRIVVAIDPAVSTKQGSDETGIIVAGIAGERFYVLDDVSGKMSPEGWARRAVGAFRDWEADRIVAEVNQGGDMCESTVRSVAKSVPFRKVHASRGKVTRAEPVAALYEQGRVHHVGSYPKLEDQLCAFTADFDRSRNGSPDRLDALVWAITELMGRGRPIAAPTVSPIGVPNPGGGSAMFDDFDRGMGFGGGASPLIVPGFRR